VYVRNFINGKILEIFALLVLLVMMFMPGVPVYAASREYEVSQYKIDVVVNPDGSADIEEVITYDFDGKFNGVFRDIDFSATGGMINPRVYAEKNGKLAELQLHSTSSLDAGGTNGTYNMVNEGQIAHFKIFEKSEDESKNFVYKYTFKDAVTKYKDIAEFNRKMVDPNWDVILNNITIQFKLPEGAALQDIKVFGHGSLLGESKIIDEQHVSFTVPYVNPGEMVETLVLFPPKLVPESANFVDREALPEIMANEKLLAERANQQRLEAQKQLEREAKMRSLGNKIALALFLVWFVILIHIYRKYDKELKHHFEGKYYRELPGEYTPAEMSVLLSMGQVTTRDITATLMDLVRKKQLVLTTQKSMKKGLFKNKETDEYILSLNPNRPAVDLKKHESFLIQWFINTLGNGSSINLDDISDYAKTQSQARRFKQDYDKWCKLAKEEADKNNFFDSTCKKGIKVGILFSALYLLSGLLLLFIFGTEAGLILILQFILLLIFSARISRRTAYGNEQKAMWDAFKNFLKDFSQMDKAKMPAIIIWEHYLVYAISLGVAKEVIKQLPLVFREEDLQDSRLTFMYGYGFGYGNLAFLSNSLDRTVDTVDRAVTNAMSVANSTLSSSTGGGGGFSGGSSGGGGGGGGGGAF